MLTVARDDPFRDWPTDDFAGRIRTLLGVDIASVATADANGHFHMAAHHGAATDAYRRLTITPGAGLGGLVAKWARPVRLTDYATSTMITADYRETVRAEGMRGLVCVPVPTYEGRSLLLYAGNRQPDSVGDRTIGQLEGLAIAAHEQLATDARTRRAVQAERHRIAAELHDTVAQVLFAIAIGADPTTGEDDDPSERLARIAELAGTGRSELRHTLRDLATGRLQAVEEGSLEWSLRDVACRLTEQTGVSVDWSMRDVPNRVLPERRLLVMDALREGLRNAAKHARTNLVLATVRGPDPLSLVLQMHAETTPTLTEFPEGSGLYLLRMRAEAIGGRLTVEAHPDGAHSIVVQRLTLPAGDR